MLECLLNEVAGFQAELFKNTYFKRYLRTAGFIVIGSNSYLNFDKGSVSCTRIPQAGQYLLDRRQRTIQLLQTENE